MDKRGQFFILGAVIIAMALFVLMVRVNTYEEKILLEDFPDLSKNYESESIKVVNDALLNELDPFVKLDEFTNGFVDYARTLDPNIGFIYVYKDKNGNSKVVNYLSDEPADIYGDDGSSSTFSNSDNSLNDVSLNLGGMEFKKTIPVKVKNFDSSYVSFDTSGDKVYIEIAGIFYSVDLMDKPFSYIAKSADPTSNQVEVSVL
ncbi:hypothetical protein J4427_00030 [Candidatus Woesearchaeota archaeon]|nr:hypothetical protein [Candidatus Woesearchaeota archaeon]